MTSETASIMSVPEVFEARATPTSDERTDKDVYTNQHAFLKAIHERFLNLVEPRESRLLDYLRESVLDSDDEQEIVAETTRRDQARSLWKHLHRVPAEDFRDHCYPILKDLYPHVLEGAECIYDASLAGDAVVCVRHVIMDKVKLRSFADKLYTTADFELKDYDYTTEGVTDDAKWDVLFKLCAKSKNSDNCIRLLQLILRDIKVKIPENLPALLSGGVLCTCTTVKCRKKRSEIYASNHLDDSKDYESDNASISNLDSITESDEIAREKLQFETKEQEDAFLREIEKTNKPISKPSKIKALFQILEAVKEELSSAMCHKRQNQRTPLATGKSKTC